MLLPVSTIADTGNTSYAVSTAINTSNKMDAREALDLTLKHYRIRATDVAEKTGIGTNELSRYRRGHNEIYANRAFDIIRALPAPAQLYFWSLCTNDQELAKS
jgi:transcriptional regulator with XRE-family HTH domain